MPRPIRVSFDLSALRDNLERARARAPRARMWAVVKANAYGHGLLRAADALQDADGFALLDLAEAIRLREAGYRHPILLLEGPFEAADLLVAAEHSLSVVIHSAEQIEMLEMGGLPCRIAVYCKLNTGMNRLGFTAEQFLDAFERLQRCSTVGALSLMTHFSDADGAGGIAEQWAVFEQLTEGIDLPRSLANSAALLRYPETHADWARPGIMLYGGSPFPDESAESLGLRPVMTLESQVIAVQQLGAGQSTGYGLSFKAERDMRVGIVACGYADGYPRHAPSGTPVLVAGKATCTVGRVSMDMLAVDLSGIDYAGIGTPVTLWGKGLSADEVAAAAGTVSYELFCALAARVPQSDLDGR